MIPKSQLKKTAAFQDAFLRLNACAAVEAVMGILFYLIDTYGYLPILLIGTLLKKVCAISNAQLSPIHRNDWSM